MKSWGRFACWGKEFFASFGVASGVAARRARANAGKKRTREQAYRCDACQGFHIGSSIKRRAGRPRVAEEIEA